MTEAEWLSCTEPMTMLEYLRDRASDRKLRLFAVACCRRIWSLLIDGRSKAAVETAERFADGLATEEERLAANEEAERAFLDVGPGAAEGGIDYWDAATSASAPSYAMGYFAAEGASRDVLAAVSLSPDAPDLSAEDESGHQASLLRDLFGNPFRPARLDPSWRTPGVTALARAIYDGRDFGRMPELADALKRAGCGDDAILIHCRGAGPHVRGCWLVDALLDRE